MTHWSWSRTFWASTWLCNSSSFNLLTKSLRVWHSFEVLRRLSLSVNPLGITEARSEKSWEQREVRQKERKFYDNEIKSELIEFFVILLITHTRSSLWDNYEKNFSESFILWTRNSWKLHLPCWFIYKPAGQKVSRALWIEFRESTQF